MHRYLHTYIPTYLHTYMPTYLHTYIPTYLPTYIQTYIHTYLHTYVYMHMCIYIYMYVCIYIYTQYRWYSYSYPKNYIYLPFIYIYITLTHGTSQNHRQRPHEVWASSTRLERASWHYVLYPTVLLGAAWMGGAGTRPLIPCLVLE